jgi:hypothetical protein
MSARTASRRIDAALAGGVLAAVAAIVAVTVVWGDAGSASARNETLAYSEASVLGAPAAASDRLPSGFPVEAHGTGGLVAASARSIGIQGGTAYWIVLDRIANVCLVAQSVADRAVTSASCVSPAEFARNGAALRVDGRWSLEAFLVPDSVDAGVASGPWVAVSRNLVVYDAAGAALNARTGSSIDLPRPAGEPLTLTLLSAPGVG